MTPCLQQCTVTIFLRQRHPVTSRELGPKARALRSMHSFCHQRFSASYRHCWELGDLEILWLYNPVITWDLQHHVKNGIKYLPYGGRLSAINSSTFNDVLLISWNWSWHHEKFLISWCFATSGVLAVLASEWPIQFKPLWCIWLFPHSTAQFESMPRMHRSVRSLILLLLAIASPWAPNFSVARKGTAAPSTVEACVNKVNQANFRRHIKGAIPETVQTPRSKWLEMLCLTMKTIHIQAANLCFDPNPNTFQFFSASIFSDLSQVLQVWNCLALLGIIPSQKSARFLFKDFGQVTRIMHTTDG